MYSYVQTISVMLLPFSGTESMPPLSNWPPAAEVYSEIAGSRSAVAREKMKEYFGHLPPESAWPARNWSYWAVVHVSLTSSDCEATTPSYSTGKMYSPAGPADMSNTLKMLAHAHFITVLGTKDEMMTCIFTQVHRCNMVLAVEDAIKPSLHREKYDIKNNQALCPSSTRTWCPCWWGDLILVQQQREARTSLQTPLVDFGCCFVAGWVLYA